MGNNNVKFIQCLNTLQDVIPAPSDHTYWIPIFTSSIDKDDLYSLLNPKKVRSIAKRQPYSLLVLLYKCIEQLHVFQQSEKHWGGQLDSVKNAILIILRVVPIMYETEEWRILLRKLFEENMLPVLMEKLESDSTETGDTQAKSGPEHVEKQEDENDGNVHDKQNKSSVQNEQNEKQNKQNEQNELNNENDQYDQNSEQKDLNKTESKLQNNNTQNQNTTQANVEKSENNTAPILVKIDRIGSFLLHEVQLGELLIHTLLKLMFLPQFSIPQAQIDSATQLSNEAAEYYPSIDAALLWQGGLVVPPKNCWSTPQQKEFRILMLKCLLALFSYPIYFEAHEIVERRNYFLDIIVQSNAPHSSNLFYSLLNSFVNYDPSGWLPYSTTLMHDAEEEYVMTCLHVLGMFLFHIPKNSEKRNIYLEYIQSFKNPKDISILHQSFKTIMRNAIDANMTYLPSSQKLFDCHDEILIILWRFVDCCPPFRHYLFKKTDQNQILEAILVLFENNAADSSKFAFSQVLSLLILMFSQHRDFCIALNRPFTGKLPMDIPRVTGNYADLLILTIHKVITKDSGILKPLYYSLITTISNISPYIKKLSILASVKLIVLFQMFSKPSYLYTGPRNWELVDLLLRTFNNLIQYQYEGSINLVYTILRKKDLFETLSLKPNIESLNEMNEKIAKDEPPFKITAEWLASWKPNLPLNSILMLINGLESDLEEIMTNPSAGEEEILEFLRSTTPIGMIPNIHMILVKTFTTSPQIVTFVIVYLLGLMYVRHLNPPLFSGQRVKLFKIHFSGTEDDES